MATANIDTLEIIFRNDFNLLCYICGQYPIPLSEHLDIIQEALTNTIVKIDSIKNKTYAGIRGYLIRAIKNLCLDYLRKDQRGQSVMAQGNISMDARSDQVADETPNPLQKIILIEDRKFHAWILGKLKPKYKPVLELVFEGIKPGRIADMLNMNPSTVREYKMKGLREYKKILNANNNV